MNRLIILASIVLFSASCMRGGAPTKKQLNARKAERLAQSIKYTVNWEQNNIVRRQTMVGDAGLTGYITLISSAGVPILYTSVAGKTTSGGKRLTKTWGRVGSSSYGYNVVAASSNDGTYGSSNPYQYWWDTSGRYYQWNGEYLFTDQPVRLRIEPLVILMETKTATPAKPAKPAQ